MQKKQSMTIAALCLAGATLVTKPAECMAQETVAESDTIDATTNDDAAFTFTEAQLGEDEDMSQNVTILNSGSNLYASEVGYAFSSTRFRYRALNQKYNDIYINGMQMNDLETGQFRYTLVGGLNNQTRNVEFSLPFEDSQFSLTALGGSNNYNFRAGSQATGHKISLAGANRNYTLRGMYTYNSGFNENGWAWSASLTYRWANTKTSYVKGTFYNSLSYFFGVEKILGDHHLSFSTWGNPTERAGQAGCTDEAYWLADSHFYNPYWGYQNGKIRNSRIVNDFAPSALFTWDWQINDKSKLTTTLGGRYSMYKSTSLDYNNSDNPQPDFWKNMPSAYYNVYDPTSNRNNDYTSEEWQDMVNYWQASEDNRQINWDRLYAANHGIYYTGQDAMYFIKAKHNDALTLQLNSVINIDLTKDDHFAAGIGIGANHGRHYMTLDDLLGASSFHNVNTYAISTYGVNSEEVQYDLNNPSYVGDASTNLKEGDKYRYDYFINVRRANGWAAYTKDFGRAHWYIGFKGDYNGYQRDGMMRNGLAKNNSYGKSDWGQFFACGGKTALTYNLGKGNTVMAGVSYETRAPQASTAFAAPEINNDFVTNLHNEHVLLMEVGYQLKSSWISLNLNGYYSRTEKGTEWQNYYFDDNNSFTYVSLTGIQKEAYGVEAGLKVKLASFLDFRALGTISDAKYLNNCHARYMLSKRAEYADETVYSEGMRESGTPLTATSLGLSFHRNGWFVELYGRWYDRIYLSWSPSLRYASVVEKRQSTGEIMYDNDGNVLTSAFDQATGHGGWMLDGSIGKLMYIGKGQLSINLSLSNILNNINICTGGYEQSRSSYTKNSDGTYSNRIYSFVMNPKKFYAWGTNGMLNITYKF